MSAAAIARHLRDFDAPDESLDERPHSPPEIIALGAVEPVAELDIAAERAAAREEGRQAGLEEARAAGDAALHLRDEEHSRALAELSARLEGEIAGKFAARFEALTIGLGREIGGQVADVLAPLVGEAVSSRMVAEFASVLSQTIAEGAAVTVSGPQALLDRLAASPALAGVEISRVVIDDADLSVEIGPTLVATRLAAWANGLREALS